MRRYSLLITLLIVAALTLIACGPAAEPAAPAPGEPVTGSPVTQDPDVLNIPAGLSEEEIALARESLQRVSDETGISMEGLRVRDVEAREWPNAGLGCPQPDMAYIDVITPGYLIEVEANGETFDVHTNQDGTMIIVCDDGQVGAAEGIQLGGEMEGIAERARMLIATETGIAEDALTIVEATEEEWSDSSLGCPDPATMYMQVITSGFRFVIEGQGEQFYVHSNRDGSNLVICEQDSRGIGGGSGLSDR